MGLLRSVLNEVVSILRADRDHALVVLGRDSRDSANGRHQLLVVTKSYWPDDNCLCRLSEAGLGPVISGSES